MGMTGRMESEQRAERKAENLLRDMPEIVADYYYNIAISSEPTTRYEYLSKIRQFLVWLNPDMKTIDFAAIKESDITRYLVSMRTYTNAKGDIVQRSFSSQKQNITILRGFFEYLVQRDVYVKNPMQNIKPPRNRDAVEHPKITAEDASDMIDIAGEGVGNARARGRQKRWRERDIAILTLFLNTGMREGALMSINVDDIKGNYLTVIDKVHKTNTYKLNDTTMKAINDWKAKRVDLLGDVKCDALFISNQRKRIGKDALTDIVKKYSGEVLGKSVSPHKLRGAFATIMYEETGNIEAVRRALKHNQVTTTQIYINDDGSSIEQAAADIERAMQRAKR